jgi:hypothetical protein
MRLGRWRRVESRKAMGALKLIHVAACNVEAAVQVCEPVRGAWFLKRGGEGGGADVTFQLGEPGAGGLQFGCDFGREIPRRRLGFEIDDFRHCAPLCRPHVTGQLLGRVLEQNPGDLRRGRAARRCYALDDLARLRINAG